MPSSSTAISCCARRRSKVSGRPMSLFKLPWVARLAWGFQACKIAASIWVTVVLPLLPVTAISGRLNCRRQPLASSARARRVSGTSRPGRPEASSRSAAPSSHSAATAPRACAWAKKSCASKRSPRRGTNRSPGASVRVSLCTLCTTVLPAPCSRAPLSQGRHWASVHMLLMLAPALERSGAVGPTAPAARPKKPAVGRPPLGRAHGPCQQSKPRHGRRPRPAPGQ